MGLIRSVALPESFQRYCLGVQYVGTKLSGWQQNVNRNCPEKEKRSVHSVLQNAIHRFVGPYNCVNIKGSSRTDAGVHAFRNTCQIDLRRLSKKGKLLEPFSVDAVKSGINYYMNSDEVRVQDVSMKTEDFDARGMASERTYLYRIMHLPATDSRSHLACDTQNNDSAFMLASRVENSRFEGKKYDRCLFNDEFSWTLNRTLDVEAMQLAASSLVGEHDFTSFRNMRCESVTPMRHISALNVAAVPQNILSVSIFVYLS